MDDDGRRAKPTPIGAILTLTPATYVDRRPRTQLDRLLQLEQDLGELLASSAPATWRHMRRSIRRLIRRARLEIRAGEELPS